MSRASRRWQLCCVCIPVLYMLVLLMGERQEEGLEDTGINELQSLQKSRNMAAIQRPLVFMRNSQLRPMNEDGNYAARMATVFRRVGYDMAHTLSDHWEVMWADTHQDMKIIMDNIKPYQRLNKVPGLVVITEKLGLMRLDYPFAPKTFRIPRDRQKMLEYVQENPNTTFVHKIRQHKGKGVHIAKLPDLKFSTHSSHMQVFIDNPFLIDGRKFDIQVYASVSSVNPLRIYIQNDEYLIRLCAENFHPFDGDVIDKYVVSVEKMILPWMDEIPSLKSDYYKHSLTNKEITFSALRDKGISTKGIEKQISDAVHDVFLANEKTIIQQGFQELKHSYHPRHFFQLIRFDFVVDENGKLWMIEANSGPGMTRKLKGRRLQIEKTFYSFLNLNGLTLPSWRSWIRSEKNESEMIVSDRDISTFTDKCRMQMCDDCTKVECHLCVPCLSEDQKVMLYQAYIEHIHKTGWRRTTPRPFKNQEAAEKWVPENDPEFVGLSPKSQMMSKWFWGKCLQDQYWCS